jgi:hypothetical protein
MTDRNANTFLGCGTEKPSSRIEINSIERANRRILAGTSSTAKIHFFRPMNDTKVRPAPPIGQRMNAINGKFGVSITDGSVLLPNL